MRKLSWLFLVCALAACSRPTLSERDARREQIRNAAETKRKELKLVEGKYIGTLHPDATSSSHNMCLSLEIKENPTPVEGQVDPVMVPYLAGYLRFNVGEGENEYIAFGLKKAEFDPKRQSLDLEASNDAYKDILMGLGSSEPGLKGKWTAPEIGISGEASFKRSTNCLASVGKLSGEYGGVLVREKKGQYQFGHLTLITTYVPPQGLKVAGTVRLIFGDWTSSEYLTYQFDDLTFNPISGQIALKGESADVALVGTLRGDEVVGEWSSKYTGKLGPMSFRKNSTPIPPATGILFEVFKGTYQGTLKNTHPESNLPERVILSFVTSPQPQGMKISGSIRFYYGPFGSQDYDQYSFSDISYNFYTQVLVAKTTEDVKLTLKGEVSFSEIISRLDSDGLGEIAVVEVKKL